MKWVLFLLIILAIGASYYYISSSEDLKIINFEPSCLSLGEESNYKIYQGDKYKVKIPNNYNLENFSGIPASEGFKFDTFKISDNELELFYIWSYGYAFDQNKLAYDTISSIDGHSIISDEDISLNKKVFKRIKAQYSYENISMIQETYAYIERNVAYVLTLRAQPQNSNNNSQILQKVACTLEVL